MVPGAMRLYLLLTRQQKESALNQEIDALKQALTEHSTALQQLEEGLLQNQAQYEALSTSEALAKEQELERLHREETEAGQTLALYRERVAQEEQSRQQAQKQEESLASQIADNESQQQHLVQGLAQTAADSNFALHEPYNLLWSQQIPADDSLWPPWQEDIARHETELEKALSLARTESHLQEQTTFAEREVSAARQRRLAQGETGTPL